MRDVKIIVECLYYILSKIKIAGKTKLIKLLYLADKYHLINYGRIVTNDVYQSTEIGPVGRTANNLLELYKLNFSEEEVEFASRFLRKNKRGIFTSKKPTPSLKTPTKAIELDMLSDTDVEALDFAIDNFGYMKSNDILNYTRKFPESRTLKDFFYLPSRKKTETRRKIPETKPFQTSINMDLEPPLQTSIKKGLEPPRYRGLSKKVAFQAISTEELLSTIDDKLFKVSKEHIEESWKIITGEYE